ncbi:carbonic anhydrase [Coniophora puteana RWD-64-598 SS2]|uniref:Carbonic anhydrase n=1 Tax=Coniophora puteana (strain RWD-64-598) TaxID=741705 RepID=A0A5M3N4H2_CONPW|nr:carbonic anhydrase [Coniophora puteana RWD-64-598 SS2]EIW85944.1 carbonic anhydrase [Coniophora puteana RWD-64-598 SS2]
MSDAIQSLVNNNQVYASEGYAVPPPFSMVKTFPRNQVVAIVSCADPRLSPEEFLKLPKYMHPIINVAGGRAKNALRSLLVYEHHFGLAGIVVVHHTDCGMTHVTDDALCATFGARARALGEANPEKGKNMQMEIDSMEWDEITGRDVHASVKSDVKYLRDYPLFSEGLKVVGLVFDLQTGRVEQVE